MTWTAPDVVGVDKPFVGPERAMLDGWLRERIDRVTDD
jgi:hypothetical protein